MLYDMIAYDMRVHRTMYFNDLFVNIKRAALFIIWGRSSFHVIQFGSQIWFQSTPIKKKRKIMILVFGKCLCVLCVCEYCSHAGKNPYGRSQLAVHTNVVYFIAFSKTQTRTHVLVRCLSIVSSEEGNSVPCKHMVCSAFAYVIHIESREMKKERKQTINS